MQQKLEPKQLHVCDDNADGDKAMMGLMQPRYKHETDFPGTGHNIGNDGADAAGPNAMLTFLVLTMLIRMLIVTEAGNEG